MKNKFSKEYDEVAHENIQKLIKSGWLNNNLKKYISFEEGGLGWGKIISFMVILILFFGMMGYGIYQGIYQIERRNDLIERGYFKCENIQTANPIINTTLINNNEIPLNPITNVNINNSYKINVGGNNS